jgi:AP2 domain
MATRGNTRHYSYRVDVGLTDSVRGVRYCPERKKFRSRIRHKGKEIHLGYFDTEAEASEVYEYALNLALAENFPAC